MESIWLENAVHRLRRQRLPQRRLFEETLEQVTTKSDGIIQKAKGEEKPSIVTNEILEEIIHKDDLLEYEWLQGALSVGKSIARLIVPRYQSGKLIMRPGSRHPIQYFGTGWLIGKQYLTTNHHVINARSPGEEKASESDLRKQAENTIVQFDYDNKDQNGQLVQVEELRAYYEWDREPILDFAVLELKKAIDRKPLSLAPNALEIAGNLQLPVNIIQHPGGNPKSLGVRNNLISRLDKDGLRYFTDTIRGSSGSPVCNDDWHVIALHRSQDFVDKNLNFQGKETAYVNYGVRIDNIINHLKANYKKLWRNIEANIVA